VSKRTRKKEDRQGRPKGATRPAPAVAPAAASTGPGADEIILALGLGMVIFLRPWFDGVVYPEKNVFFIWPVVLLAMLWGVRYARRGERFRFVTPTLLLTGFLGVALLGMLDTAQYHNTYKSLLVWTGNLLVFVLAANGLRTRKAIAIVLGAFVVTSIGETIWSIIHVNYVLPATRQEVDSNPLLMRLYFHTDTLTPALRDRLNSNRAFGSFLLANTLAAWVLLGIPVALGGAGYSIVSLGRRLRRKAEECVAPWWRALVAGFATFCLSLMTITIYYSLYFSLKYRGEHWQSYAIRWAVYCLAIPALLALVACVVTRRRGLYALWFSTSAAVLGGMFVLQLAGLWCTYSRGGMLATAVALATMAVLHRLSARAAKSANATTLRVAAVVLAVALGTLAAGLHGNAAADAPSAQETAAAPSKAPPAGKAPEPESEIRPEGQDVTLSHFTNPATMFLRLSYWKAGVLMAKDNLLTGVGLGNFGVMYPKYQPVGAGDVQEAHNDPLQVLCETGVFGLLLFAGFWVWMLLWGVRRILSERDTADRWLLGGLFASVLAFLLHSFVDFDFFNPSLATAEFLLAGLFLALGRRPADDAAQGTAGFHRIAAAAAVIVALVAGMASYPVYAMNSFVGGPAIRGMRLEAAAFFAAQGIPKDEDRETRRQVPIKMAASLLDPNRSRELLESFGQLYVRKNPNTTDSRLLAADEPVPREAILLIDDPQKAREVMGDVIQTWITAAEAADEIHPHDPKMSVHIFQWYDILWSFAQDPDEKRQYAAKCLRWSRESLKRSPFEALYHDMVGRGLWRVANADAGARQIELLREAVTEFEQSVALYPVRPEIRLECGKRMISLGQALIRAGKAHNRAPLVREGEALLDKGGIEMKRASELSAEWDRIIREKQS
jgi:O-antigen ligase